ncbi:MAG: DUF1800 domain-containing protein [Fimbriimonas sp.]
MVTDREKCAHLLRRFGLGASEAELDFYLKDGLNGAIDRLLESGEDDGISLSAKELVNDKGQTRMPLVVSGWVLRMLGTRRPLREKMTLFWHDHFATSASKVTQGPLMFQQNETLRRNATGSFRTLLHDVSQDPAMLFWLDNQENVRGKPNENFAREVMELFTLGVDQGYTERDVQEAARAFTGWAYRRKPVSDGIRGTADFLFRPRLHDGGEKTVLGSRGDLSGEDVLNLLCDRPRTAEYLVHKIWEWFVYPNPEPATLAPFVRRFQASRLDIGTLLKDIMRSSEFYSAKAERAVFKNPVDFCVATLRQLGYGEIVAERLRAAQAAEGDRIRRAALQPGNVTQNAMKSMGMWLMYPPDVAGWEGGAGWISSATMVERIGWADKVFGEPAPKRQTLRYPAYGLLRRAPTPSGVVDTLLSTFDANLKADRRPLLISAATKTMGDGLTTKNAGPTAVAVSRLIFAAPEFQLA